METEKRRISWIDELRGVALLAMILHHITFNLTDFLHLPLPWLRAALASRAFSLVQTVFIAIFFGISGICCRFSHRPFLRAGRVLLGAAAVTAVTWGLFPSQTIWFGVLHCLAVCMGLYAVLRRWIRKIPPIWGMAAALLLFVITYRVPDGFLLTLPLPAEWYRGGFLTIFGFSGPFFTTLDYVPLLPHLFLFLAGVFIGRLPLPVSRTRSRFLAFFGRHSLAVYLLHQPVLFGAFFCLEKILEGMKK